MVVILPVNTSKDGYFGTIMWFSCFSDSLYR